jgi:hypothetical protein
MESELEDDQLVWPLFLDLQNAPRREGQSGVLQEAFHENQVESCVRTSDPPTTGSLPQHDRHCFCVPEDNEQRTRPLSLRFE